jgi:hypothetical protein
LEGDPCADHCTNGIQDCGESGIDCGGACGTCFCPNEQVGEVSEALQWRVTERFFTNSSYAGNPFDLEARALWLYCNSGETFETRLFYAGGDNWGLHFTGRQPGRWIFTLSSDDSDLDGLQGTILVRENSGVNGFHQQFGNKWGWSGSRRAFVPQIVMNPYTVEDWGDPALVDEVISLYVRDHGFNGLHARMGADWYHHEPQDTRNLQEIVSDLNGGCPDPDIQSFANLKHLIEKAHRAGAMIHIWQWFDSQRAQTPNHLPGGANGPCDRRLQNYIAAYLGPVPGWSMGYGFDVQEYEHLVDIDEWYAYLTAEMGPYFHPLSARWGDPLNAIGMFYEGLSVASYQQHQPTYEDYRAGFTTYPEKMQFFEDRFRLRPTCGGVRPEKDYTMQMMRRGLWHSTMAGGAANIWGVLAALPPDCHCARQGFPRPDWVKTWAEFWKNRFLRDLQPAAALAGGPAHCLKNDANTSFVFFVEDSATIEMDLSNLSGNQPAIAVDTTAPYAEIDLGVLSAEQQVFEAPNGMVSDWAVAVGDFTEQPFEAGAPITPTDLWPARDIAVTADEQQRVTLTWSPVEDAVYRVTLLRRVADGFPTEAVAWTETVDPQLVVPVELDADYRWKVQSRDPTTEKESTVRSATFRVREIDACDSARPHAVHDGASLIAFVEACFANDDDGRAQEDLPNTDCENDFQTLMRDVRDRLIALYPTIHYTHPAQNNHCTHLDSFAVIGSDGYRYIVDYVVDSAAGGVLLDKLSWQVSEANVCQ